MIEIILRKDIQEYEARPLFGFTYRQVATSAIIAATASVIGIVLTNLGVMPTIILMVVCSVCTAIGFLGIGSVHGLKPELWWRIWKEDRSWPRVSRFSPVIIDPASARAEASRKLTRAERITAKRDAAAAAAESELCLTFKKGN